MLILTLMRLRLNVTALFLSYAFEIVTVSRVCTGVIDVMYIRMKLLVFLPSREEL